MLIRHGAICKTCKNGCEELPTEALPRRIHQMPCPECGGDAEERKTCVYCRASGVEKITDCPRRIIQPEIWEAIRQFKLADKGAMPESGGTNDQCETFLRAWEAFTHLEAECEASKHGGG